MLSPTSPSRRARRKPRRSNWRNLARRLRNPASCRNFLTSPAVDIEAKHGVIEKITGRQGAGKTIRNFLYVIVDHQRSYMLPEIIAAVEAVIRQRQGIAEAEVSSAVELTAAQKAELAKTLGRLTGKKVEPRYSGSRASWWGGGASWGYYLRRFFAQPPDGNAGAAG